MMEVSVTKILSPPGVPAGQRSPLWGYEAEIRRLLAEGWSYRQIAAALEKAGVSVTVGWLQKWGRANLGPLRRPAKKTGSVPAAQATPAPESGASAPLANEGAAGLSMEELLAQAGARASRPTPKPKSSAAGDPVADLLKKVK